MGGFHVGFSGTMPAGDEKMALQLYTADASAFPRWILIS